MIVIGLGTGRSGTASLAKLLNAQHDALCFHEMNPSSVRFAGTPRPILNAIDEYQRILDGGDSSMVTVDLSRRVSAEAYDSLRRMKRVKLIGDIALYYLTYVEAIARHNPNVRFICLRRDVDSTVQSWMKKTQIRRWPSAAVGDRIRSVITRQPYYESSNFWMEHDGTKWIRDPVWDKCFPKFEAGSKTEAIRKYCEYYYAEAERISVKLGERFKFVETNQLNDRSYQPELLRFVGIADTDQVFTDAHIHQSD